MRRGVPAAVRVGVPVRMLGIHICGCDLIKPVTGKRSFTTEIPSARNVVFAFVCACYTRRVMRLVIDIDIGEIDCFKRWDDLPELAVSVPAAADILKEHICGILCTVVWAVVVTKHYERIGGVSDDDPFSAGKTGRLFDACRIGQGRTSDENMFEIVSHLVVCDDRGLFADDFVYVSGKVGSC